MKAFAPATFATVYACAYVVVLALDLPLFLYYPLNGSLAWAWRPLTSSGPAMAWYGLMASAAIAAMVLAFCVPDRMTQRKLQGYLWVVPGLAILGCTYLMRNFFLLW